MSITIPDELLCSSKKNENEVRREIALALYASEVFTRTEACRFLSMDELEFLELAETRGIPLRYDVEDWEADTLRKLGAA